MRLLAYHFNHLHKELFRNLLIRWKNLKTKQKWGKSNYLKKQDAKLQAVASVQVRWSTLSPQDNKNLSSQQQERSLSSLNQIRFGGHTFIMSIFDQLCTLVYNLWFTQLLLISLVFDQLRIHCLNFANLLAIPIPWCAMVSSSLKITVKLQLLMRVTNQKCIRVDNPLHKQSEKAYMCF